LRFGKRKKSNSTKPHEYGGCGMTFILYVANNSGRDKAVAELQDMNLLAFW